LCRKTTKNEFPNLVSGKRFVTLQKKTVVPMAIFLKTCCLGQCTGISIFDSTPLKACYIRRKNYYKTFIYSATKGQLTTHFVWLKMKLFVNNFQNLFFLTYGKTG
jgi:hypothetical protein